MFPGGRKLQRESATDCLRREIKEELPKLKLGRLRLWKEVTSKNRHTGRKMSDAIFIAKRASGRLLIGDKNEIDRAGWRKPRSVRLTEGGYYNDPEHILDDASSDGGFTAIRWTAGHDWRLPPVRAYAGLDSAASVEERARLAVDDLQRAGGFSRSVLVVASGGVGLAFGSAIVWLSEVSLSAIVCGCSLSASRCAVAVSVPGCWTVPKTSACIGKFGPAKARSQTTCWPVIVQPGPWVSWVPSMCTWAGIVKVRTASLDQP